MSKIFHCSAVIEQVSTRADNTIKLTVGTQELPPEEMALLMGYHKKQGWMMFSEDTMTADDIPDYKPERIGDGKTPSQRLRAVLFLYWDKNTNKKTPFDIFYVQWMERKINEVKETLD